MNSSPDWTEPLIVGDRRLTRIKVSRLGCSSRKEYLFRDSDGAWRVAYAFNIGEARVTAERISDHV